MTSLKSLIRPAAFATRDAIGRATASRRVLPDLLVIGGQRCGTTSLYHALNAQPHLFRPTWRKGVHYFDVDYPRGDRWYRAHFPLRSTVERARERYGSALTFESSPYYMFHPDAPERINTLVPQAKIVVLVRDPVERAYSAHAHEHARGYEELGFAEALAAEDERLEGELAQLRTDPAYVSHRHRHQAYRSRGEYAVQLERLASIFGRNRMRVVDSHRFFADPLPVYDELLDWLGVSRIVTPVFEQHNARPRVPIDDALRRRLDDHFVPHDEKLADWLGHTPTWRA